MVNFKVVATKLGEGVKYATTINEINRMAKAVFDFEVKHHPNQDITSTRSQLVYDWVITLSEQPMDEEAKVAQLDEFVRNITPADSALRALTRFSDVGEAASFWSIIHPAIAKVARGRFEGGYFADAVESALKDVNNRVKKHVKGKTKQELDGASLMNRAFSANRPVIALGNLKTDTGKSIQKGYMQIFAGSMTGIRNPKAHANITIDQKRAIHYLIIASLLMYKLDEAGVP
ncbi:TIGR02391 family protein [candidate division TA06 bacterium]|uniref:TIGR02391 family protein n=1 Tax=candidate division TA06 bacterium TaxID=2250710 RepID=A0A523UWC0_UNCT6|nr:MAG: TIGR02391 family protein [candidate division TA06 bacterium]